MTTQYVSRDLFIRVLELATFASALERSAINRLPHDPDSVEEALDRSKRLDGWRKTIGEAKLALSNWGKK